jgi:SOS regulatory protein LexA
MTKSSQPTLKQNKILKTIKDFQEQNGFFPSTRDLGKLLKLKSPNTIFSHLRALESKGYLKKNLKGQILQLAEIPFQFTQSIQQSFSIPFFNESIPAGFQAPAEDAGREMLTVDQYLIKSPTNTFALKVKGNSMEKAGIMPGDLLLVEKREDARPGQIIVAHLPTGFTVKRLVEEDGQRYLQAESSQDYQIKLEEGTEIWGIVIGTVRKY